MNNLIHADIFFFITTIAVIILTILISIVLYHLISILKDIKKTTQSITDTVEEATEDIEAMGKKIHESALFNFIFKKQKSKKR